jgi:hypothetical protein
MIWGSLGKTGITCWGVFDWGSLGNTDNSLGSIWNLTSGGLHGKRMIQCEMHAYEYAQYDAGSMLTLGICQWYVGLMLWLGAEHGRAFSLLHKIGLWICRIRSDFCEMPTKIGLYWSAYLPWKLNSLPDVIDSLVERNWLSLGWMWISTSGHKVLAYAMHVCFVQVCICLCMICLGWWMICLWCVNACYVKCMVNAWSASNDLCFGCFLGANVY